MILDPETQKRIDTMPRKVLVIVILGVAISGITISSIFVSAEEGLLPLWIKTIAGFWSDDQISDNEFINALQYLVEQGILVIPDATQTIEDTHSNLSPSLHAKLELLRLETNSKLDELKELGNDLQIQQLLIDSNQEFANIDNVSLLIDERDNDWTSVDKDEVTPFMAELINNDVSEQLRKIISEDKKEGKDFVYEEIFITNAYGVNVAQSGKTTDYKQYDELWWNMALQTGFSYLSGYDESAGVNSLDISMRIDGKNGELLGIIKSVINIESLPLERFQ